MSALRMYFSKINGLCYLEVERVDIIAIRPLARGDAAAEVRVYMSVLIFIALHSPEIPTRYHVILLC